MLRSGSVKGCQLWVFAVNVEDEELVTKLHTLINRQPGAEVRKVECVVRPSQHKDKNEEQE